MHIDDLLKVAAQSGASDLHLKVGSYPMMRVNGTLAVCSEEKRLDKPTPRAWQTPFSTDDQREKFRRAQEVDLAYSIPEWDDSVATSSSNAALSASSFASSRPGLRRSTNLASRRC
jgi:Tfp pilus assembly pilus retraction ATPase PilT